jgi:hypothetical protein
MTTGRINQVTTFLQTSPDKRAGLISTTSRQSNEGPLFIAGVHQPLKVYLVITLNAFRSKSNRPIQKANNQTTLFPVLTNFQAHFSLSLESNKRSWPSKRNIINQRKRSQTDYNTWPRLIPKWIIATGLAISK